MFGPSCLLSSFLLVAQSADLQFHDWCSSVGITVPLAKLETTPRSVAGRGLFATENIQVGDIAMSIPDDAVLHEYNMAARFPDLAKKLWKDSSKLKFQDQEQEHDGSRRRRWWHRLLKRHRQSQTFEFTESSDLWQATLTCFSLACMENDDHPFKYWISQWQRSDPMQSLFEKGATWRDVEDVLSCVEELSEMLPDVSKIKLRAAVEMRLGRLEELKTIFDLEDKDSSNKVSKMFGLLTSRAIGLGDGVLGVLPMFDMLNHSNDPNLALSFDGERFSLWAVRDIAEGEELFVSYKDTKSEGLEWDEDDAIWMLVQWGIPLPKPRNIETTTTKDKKEVAYSS